MSLPTTLGTQITFTLMEDQPGLKISKPCAIIGVKLSVLASLITTGCNLSRWNRKTTGVLTLMKTGFRSTLLTIPKVLSRQSSLTSKISTKCQFRCLSAEKTQRAPWHKQKKEGSKLEQMWFIGTNSLIGLTPILATDLTTITSNLSSTSFKCKNNQACS